MDSRITDLADLDLQEPWLLLSPSEAQPLEAQLTRELRRGHVLWKRPCRAVVRHVSVDDVLYILEGSPDLALVHLSWGNPSPPWPTTKIYSSVTEWRGDAYLPDLEEFQG